MSIAPGILSRAAATAAVLAGITFMAVQIGHPHLDVTSVDTAEWVVRNTAKMAFAALALTGITGMYLRQVKETGVLGLIAYVLLSTGYLLIFSTAFVAGYVLPSLAESAPNYVNGVLTAAAGGTATSDIGLIEYALAAEGITYLAGGLLFGIALFRARILTRWGSALLSAGAVFTISLSVLPEDFYRLLAYPNAIALIALGYSLWRAAQDLSEPVPDAGAHPGSLKVGAS
jgi:hypothetical protein